MIARMLAALLLVSGAMRAETDAGVALPEARPLGVELSVQPEEVSLGDRIHVRIAIEHDSRDVYALPSVDPAPLAVPQGTPPPQSQREEQQGKARTIFTLELADMGTLEPRVPDLVFRVTGPEGERALHLRGKPLQFRSLVKSEGQGAPDAAHHGPKPPVPVYVRSYLWAGLLAALLALGAAIAGTIYWRRHRKKPAAFVPPPPEFDEVALDQLAKLRKAKPHTRATIFQLSEIVRTYLGARLAFNALDLTSDELLAALRERRLLGVDLEELTATLRWEDMVKFAKLEFTPADAEAAIDRAESLVRHTRPQRAKVAAA